MRLVTSDGLLDKRENEAPEEIGERNHQPTSKRRVLNKTTSLRLAYEEETMDLPASALGC